MFLEAAIPVLDKHNPLLLLLLLPLLFSDVNSQSIHLALLLRRVADLHCMFKFEADKDPE